MKHTWFRAKIGRVKLTQCVFNVSTVDAKRRLQLCNLWQLLSYYTGIVIYFPTFKKRLTYCILLSLLTGRQLNHCFLKYSNVKDGLRRVSVGKCIKGRRWSSDWAR